MRPPPDGAVRRPLERLFVPTVAQVARERGIARERTAADRAWRRAVARLVAACVASQALAVAIGASGWAVADESIGQLLVKAGEAGSLLFPFMIVVCWVAEAHRNGDL